MNGEGTERFEPVASKVKTDLDFLDLVRRGDPEGATGLFEKYAEALLRFSDRMLSNRAEAEEITQEVFLKMITRVEQYDGRAAVSSWLFAIAANACRDRLRRSRRATVVPLDAVAEAPSKAEPADHRLRAGRRQAVGAPCRGSPRSSAGARARYHGIRRHRPHAPDYGRPSQAGIFRAMETLKGILPRGTTWMR
jgi:RNA polymerase sigma factor (sigma-70 family)